FNSAAQFSTTVIWPAADCPVSSFTRNRLPSPETANWPNPFTLILKRRLETPTSSFDPVLTSTAITRPSRVGKNSSLPSFLQNGYKPPLPDTRRLSANEGNVATYTS